MTGHVSALEPTDTGRRRLLHVHAHPDDESSKGAASTARYVAEGVEVLVVTCTGGERGTVLNPAMDSAGVGERIAEVRRAEMSAARDVLGIRQHWLGYVDSGWPDGSPLSALPEDAFALQVLSEPVAALVEVIREFRPHVVTTYAEDGDYPHPDHLMCSRVTRAAFAAAGDPEQHASRGSAWTPAKLYHHRTFDPERLVALGEVARAAGLPRPYPAWLREQLTPPTPRSRPATRVSCARWFGIRDEALRAHATQVEPDGPWLALPTELEARAWPTEDFDLVHTAVPVPWHETDLFAGL